MNWKKLIINILIPVVLGTIVGLLSNSDSYKMMIRPDFAPPSYVFPIVWTILFILMGISSYLVDNSNSFLKDDALKTYRLQLFVNLVWPFIFFTFKFYLVAFIWLLILLALVIYMIVKFYKISKISAYLQIPYLLWLLFAAYLNFGVYLLN